MRQTAVKKINVTSSSFEHMGLIPQAYTCDGSNVYPSLSLGALPEGTRSLAVIMDDPDAPNGTFTHWMVWNVKPVTVIEEGRLNDGVTGINDWGNNRYQGPCPSTGRHRYFFKIYALDSFLGLDEDISRKELEQAIEGKLLAYGEHVGLYQRP